MSLPRVSVIVPAYAQAGFLAGCLDSIAAQTYSGSVEVVVVDDGCPDDSAAVAEAHPLRPKVVRQANRGAAAARNRGIAESRGELVAFIDADDRWDPRKLERQVAAIEARGEPAFSFTRFRRTTVDGQKVGKSSPSDRLVPSGRLLLYRNFVGCSTVMTHRVCLDRAGGFPESEALRRCGQDYALWLRVAARHPLVFVNEVLTDYTVHPGNRVGTDSFKHHEGAVAALLDFERWDKQQFDRVARTTVARIVARRSLRLVRVCLGQTGLFGTDWKRLSRVVRRQLQVAN